jgi:hypothetical protein
LMIHRHFPLGQYGSLTISFQLPLWTHVLVVKWIFINNQIVSRITFYSFDLLVMVAIDYLSMSIVRFLKTQG